jgi:hypothetical protein
MGHARKAVEEARAFKEAVASQATSFSQSIDLRRRVERNPIAMVLAGLGVGYVLGGGLFSPFTAKLLRYGVRIALIPILKSQLEAMAGPARGGAKERPALRSRDSTCTGSCADCVGRRE